MKEPKTFLSQPRIIVTQEFIDRNRLLLKSQDEIKDKFADIQKSELYFNFKGEVLMDYASYENIKAYLKEEYIKKIESGEAKWEAITSIEECAQDFLDYMNFAWGKAEDERGISASRSIQKLGMWLWLMSREDLAEIIANDDLYNPYGAPALIEVCNQMGIDVPKSLIEFAKTPC